jgi:pyruvate carboxylase
MAFFQSGNTTSFQMHLFVYGSLLSTFQNIYADVLHERGEFCGQAYILGRLYQVSDYPGVLLSGKNKNQIWGEIYQVDLHVLTLLDQYEGYYPGRLDSEYIRQKTIAYTKDDRQIPVWVYEYNLPIEESLRIISGSWIAHIQYVSR